MLLGAWVATTFVAVHALLYYVGGGGVGMDAHAYWTAGHVTHPYQAGPGEMDAYLYSPLFLQVVRPLTWLPWHAFLALWLCMEAVAYWWLLQRTPWRWRVPGLLLAVPELLLGNVYAFIGVAIVVGWRRPETWAFPLLTKITPAAPGFAWMLARGEWVKLLRAGCASGALVAVSYAVQPRLWSEWISFLATHSGEGGGPAAARTLVACLLTMLAARSHRRWAVPLAVLFSMPVNGGLGLGGPMNGIYAMLAVTIGVYWCQRAGTLVEVSVDRLRGSVDPRRSDQVDLPG